jgi:hypothetical protein
MSRFLKIVTLALLILLAAGSLFAQSSAKPAWPAYPLAIILGYGTGQYYVGANGTPFLVADIVGDVAVYGGLIWAVSSAASVLTNPSATGAADAATGVFIGYGLVGVGSVVLLVSRIWQIVDVFGAVDKAKSAGKVVEVVPVVDVQRTSFELGVSLKY